ncbi:MAG: DUF6048 family protein [Salinimicrobium sp.]
MKPKRIFLLLISLASFLPSAAIAQETQAADSLQNREKYGLRLGVDISKPVRSLIDEDYQGLEINGDYRIYKSYYLAGEIGNEQNTISEANVTASAKGSYIKLGANYNAYHNWSGMQNMIYAGFRYAFATFSSELQEYSIYTTDTYFEPDIRLEQQDFSNLTASWAELQLGIKVEVLNNLFLGTHVELKRIVTQTRPTNFDNLYIPGFNRTFDGSYYGVGYGYSISYLVPFYKK